MWSLPAAIRRGDGRPKALLRAVLDRHLPPRLTDRPKRGFSVPLGDWLRGPLRDWAEALLDESRLRGEGFFDPAPVRRAWRRQLGGAACAHRLWSVLMFQAWRGAGA